MPEDAEKRRKRYAEDPEYRKKLRKESSDYTKANRDKVNAYKRRRYAADPEYRAKDKAKKSKPDNRLKANCRKHGISVEQYQAILVRQQNACGICEQPFRCTPCIDHCHKTRMVRGLLCSKCNLGLGNYNDNPDFLRGAASYLERWHQRLSEIHDREENDMTDDPAEESKAAGLVRKAILLELHQPCGVDLPPPIDKLQALARALVAKAEAAHDLQAIREVFDRIGGRTPSAAASDESPKQVNGSRKNPASPLIAP
jgi:hypothetical protein